MSQVLSPPAGLRAAGRRLWADMTAAYELEPGESAVLTEACRLADELERLRVALRGARMTTTGSQGQPVANPLLGQLRAHRASLARLLTSLRPDPAEARRSHTRLTQANTKHLDLSVVKHRHRGRYAGLPPA